ncbi:EF-P beta-lysylation protein EpmB [Legionella sp. PATHC032]|uniref:EF-P beta-lysylation protein EpmB n=1 Tax=Legionella sp. PATHC032 TaxID=2992039 RepID=UPI001AFE52BA|nr:EF-P beta-lysylation protein EpmB [Legionella sp. PATHC032]MCW8420311.1 EF-P beta-lysylation protein EpmB [Legionella sp. PATHC032]HAZ7572950.1 EF-P beta-lysylation protein EpmB [Legionella pneumophila]HBA1635931.1 EF-P beta-lysylation protein EpmB [Legionella pneumophila]
MRDTSLSWQKILAQGFTSTTDLLDFLELPRSEGNLFAEKQFPSRIPLGFANRMQKGNLQDPLLLQVLAKGDELAEAEDYVIDPLSESNTLIKGLLHKYHGRVLLTLTGVCAVNCRYCFRRHFPYQANNPGRRGWKEVCAYIANDPSITEVILSGGDPLLAANLVLEELLQSLEEISHVHTLRIHTRIPIVLPERIDKGLLNLLTNTRFKKVVVVHCNHPQELDESVLQACSDLKKTGCYLLNQSVLLAGINDDALILSRLSHALFDYGIMPYYLHLLDKVKGSAHFDMPFLRARSIYHQLQSLVPGYLLPRLVREEPGRSSKTLLI